MREPTKITSSKQKDKPKVREIKTPPVRVDPKRVEQIREKDLEKFKRLGAKYLPILALILSGCWLNVHLPRSVDDPLTTTTFVPGDYEILNGKNDRELEESPELGVPKAPQPNDICKEEKKPQTNAFATGDNPDLQIPKTAVYCLDLATVEGTTPPLGEFLDSLQCRWNNSTEILPLQPLSLPSIDALSEKQLQLLATTPVNTKPLVLSIQLLELTESSGRSWEEASPYSATKMRIRVTCTNVRDQHILFDHELVEEKSLPVAAGFGEFNANFAKTKSQSPSRKQVEQQLLTEVLKLMSNYFR